MARTRTPDNPVACYRLAAVDRALQFFQKHFLGTILYSVKTNPDLVVLDELYANGVRSFDVASIAETQMIAERFPDAQICYMHPVKSRASIRQAYFEYGVRVYPLDTADELDKIMSSTDNATDLTLLVRLSVPNTHSELVLSEKFGVSFSEAPDLMMQVRKKAKRIGVCFHVGSQCMNPDAYAIAIRMVGDLIKASGVMIDILDVGGGFPSVYANMVPPAMIDYMQEIASSFEMIPASDACELWAEPGRALVAEAGSTVTRVELRRGDRLYLNDGTHGSLFDAGTPGFVFPVRAVRLRGRTSSKLIPFTFYGPTCDGLDYMKGPFHLPADIAEGDYVEIGNTGAYGSCLRTRFNGYGVHDAALLKDGPIMTMYGAHAGRGKARQMQGTTVTAFPRP
ncbi:MAG TPA: type III PLP-dependent enzyme [Rhodospirillales bacterium]